MQAYEEEFCTFSGMHLFNSGIWFYRLFYHPSGGVEHIFLHEEMSSFSPRPARGCQVTDDMKDFGQRPWRTAVSQSRQGWPRACVCTTCNSAHSFIYGNKGHSPSHRVFWAEPDLPIIAEWGFTHGEVVSNIWEFEDGEWFLGWNQYLELD